MTAKEEDEMITYVRDRLKVEFMSEQYLPHMPNDVAEEMFILGVHPWTYRYWDSNIIHHKKSSRIEFVVQVLLKKNFRKILQKHRFKFYVSGSYKVESRRVKFTKIVRLEGESSPPKIGYDNG